MKAIILCAGFGTRLEKDLKDDNTGLYEHLLGIPKPLLPVGKEPLITHWAKILHKIASIDAIYIVTNAVNNCAFETWAKGWSKVQLVCDGASSNETRSGAIACIQLALTHFCVEDDILIIAGDTLFYDDFHLSSYINKFSDFKLQNPYVSMLLYVTCVDEEVHKYGILETNAEGRVTGFLEKPQPEETSSRKECPCFYFLNRHSLPVLAQFLKEKKDEPLKTRDATGLFIAYLYKREPVCAVEISGRFDVGGLETYLKCCDYFADKNML